MKDHKRTLYEKVNEKKQAKLHMGASQKDVSIDLYNKENTLIVRLTMSKAELGRFITCSSAKVTIDYQKGDR